MQIDVLAPTPHSIIRPQLGLRGGGGRGRLEPQPHSLSPPPPFLPFTLSPSLLFFHLTLGIDGCRDESGDAGQAKGSESSFGLNT